MTTSDAVRAGLWTALFTFITLFGLSALGWLNAVLSWAQDGSGAVVFPDARVLVKAAISAGVAALVGLVNLVVRLAQARLGLGTGPSYSPVPYTRNR